MNKNHFSGLKSSSAVIEAKYCENIIVKNTKEWTVHENQRSISPRDNALRKKYNVVSPRALTRWAFVMILVSCDDQHTKG